MLKSQEMRKLAPEMDPLRIGTGWKKEDLEKPQIMVESTYGDSHPGSGHLNLLVEEVRKGVAEAGASGRGISAPTSVTARARNGRHQLQSCEPRDDRQYDRDPRECDTV